MEYYAEQTPRGEFVLVVEGAAPAAEDAELTLEEAVVMAQALVEQGERPADAAKTVARQTAFKKSELYQGLLQTKE